MRASALRIWVDARGFDELGVFWGPGLPLFHCPEIDALKPSTRLTAIQSSFVRAADHAAALKVFEARVEFMLGRAA